MQNRKGDESIEGGFKGLRHAFKMTIRPGTEQEYDRRQRSVYPELLQVFRDAGVKTYSIFRDGVTLFGYMEMDNPEETLRRINLSDINARWQAYMADILLTSASDASLPEVFHFEL
ncbi:MAG: L-rhamnose mutarotase [Sulfobacillus acidophilus]|uniref:L-rhamnose mutarotase n=1 Tax=Sulfobacillus acidophilus TaxID=53633 RepID=A0A2T2WD96_9FIRM|nr:MAG: L-rhamnose mutarotase [Sulfobacillus acidophilus]